MLDVRWVALPCVLVASALQYINFAKKPMAAPCHRLPERFARRCVFVGLLAEILALLLLPLCETYPMNASCLVCIYFWKETRRSKAVQFSDVLACISALSAWLLPFIDPTDGYSVHILPDSDLLDMLFGPRTCVYVAIALLGGVVVQCFQSHGGGALGSTAAPAANFCVSALFLKALVQVVVSVVFTPTRIDLWAVALILIVLLLGARSAAATPLRRALEAHDRLSVLASYGMTSSATAALTGSFVYHETEAWPIERQVLSFVVAIAHCWGMASLSTRGIGSPRGDGIDNVNDQDEHCISDRGWSTRDRDSKANALQMAELPGRGPAASGSNAVPNSSPLLDFSSQPRTVDEDADIEDQLIVQALAPQRLSSVIDAPLSSEPDGYGGDGLILGLSLPSGWESGPVKGPINQGWGTGFPGSPQFDADFEEIMRRFDEDDKNTVLQADQAITPNTGLGVAQQTTPMPVAPPLNLGVSMPAVEMDAQDLLDGGFDDEDQLLQNIQDIEDL